MGPESSLPHSQEQPPVSILNEVIPVHAPSHFPKIHFIIMLPSMPVSCEWFLSLSFPHQNRVYTSHFPHSCYISRRSHSPCVVRDHVPSFISLFF